MEMDLDSVRLTVNRIEYDGVNNDIKNYVMDPTPDLHCGCPVLIDDNGIEYQVSCASHRRVSAEGEKKSVEYWFEFDEDKDPNFPIGKSFSRRPARWKKELPNSRLVSINYESHGIVFGTSETFDKINISVNENGEVNIVRGKSKNLSEDRVARFQVGEDDARELLDDMLRCVSKADCYDNMYCDDTARTIVYHFENGHAVSFGGTYAYGDDDEYNDTVQIMERFKEKCRTNVFRTEYSGKSLKETFEKIGSEVGDVAERIVDKTSRMGKKVGEIVPKAITKKHRNR